MSLLAVFVASVLGSVHCVAMCGAFATVAATGGGGGRAAWRPTLTYQAGRLLGYLGLGAAAGGLGAGLDVAGETLLGLQRAAGLLTGAVLVTMALAALWPRRAGRRSWIAGESLVTLRSGRARGRSGRRWLAGALRRGDAMGAGVVGLGSALLPCGWLWGYVLVAAATGAVLPAMAVMLAFWAGGLPALLSVGLAAGVAAGAVASSLRRRLGPYAPRIVAVVMLALGVLALAGKLGPAIDPPAPADSPTTPAPCHH